MDAYSMFISKSVQAAGVMNYKLSKVRITEIIIYFTSY